MPRLQFRLRSAFVAMTLGSVPLAWFGAQLREYQAEQAALATFESPKVEFHSQSALPSFL